MPSGGGNQTNHTYSVSYVPATCKTISVGTIIRVEVVDPPPSTITLNYGGGCDGIVANLIS